MHDQVANHRKHQRKRVNLEKEEYLHLDNKILLLDKVCLIFSVLMPATTIPQIWLIFKHQEVGGLSLAMWIFYTIGVIPFFVYAIVHKEKPLIILNILWLIAQIIIITGILIYR
ncbi:MAG: SemiSWEET family transporter [Parcubacteria group bacterium]